MKEKSSFEAAATRVSAVSIAVNFLLAAFKFAAGLIGHSGAMISDAVHSSSDVFGSLIVIAGVKMSEKASDKDHPYGHERMECVASLLLSFILAAAAFSIGKNAVTSIVTRSYLTAEAPGMLALLAAIVSICVKEILFHYTMSTARRIRSGALKAEAWHHRSDALSSVGALIGIAGARFGSLILEPVASLVISVFILKAAVDIFREAVDNMVDHAADTETEEAIRRCVSARQGVMRIDSLRTRQFGRRIYVDLEIAADGKQSLQEAHGIAQQVHDEIEKSFPEVKHIMVHVNPFTDSCFPDIMDQNKQEELKAAADHAESRREAGGSA
ncbi:MAG: cation transporter [Lachnospiraceae bacterium]|nr:cation transporter [Lachnospiraceae bacterium]